MAKESIFKSTKNITVAKDVSREVKIALNDAMKQLVDETVEVCADRARANLKGVGAVDTGAGLESIYTSVPGKDGFPEAVLRALAKKPKSKWFTRPRKGFGRVDYKDNSYYAGFCAVAAEYLRYVEHGKVNVGARPFLEPAKQQTDAEYRKRAQEILKRLLPK